MPASPEHNPGPKASGLNVRVMASLLLAPPVVLAIYAGTPFIEPLIIISAGIMAREWGRLCCRSGPERSSWVMMVAVIVPLLALPAFGVSLSWPLLLLGAVVAALFAARDRAEPRLVILGTLYIGVACLAFLLIRGHTPDGRFLALWLVAIVWAADSGAYLFGRVIGGPKLAPKISPKKTWAGFTGAMIMAALVSWIFVQVVGAWSSMALVLAAAGLAAIEQVGDLLISMLKRYFGVKDTGALIPGHGGLLDRTDGLLLASVAAAAYITLVGTGGMHD
ncbi:phosphatidate cytidylyltransferase [Limibacillus halophilus]|uniref:Phosphatidate cytidylyltransferase n=1 Tax=Limibacillus halophilus TaxID=1579333 RepID=A0A839SW13_9PROT|nr:phosphatidate cytidylyltransferase [Limibacillus halophilus]MBB3065880.1 phosphatidate cytidylyltransferase [Limibacillus halophilus]